MLLATILRDIKPLAAVPVVVSALFLASCTSTGTTLDVSTSGFAGPSVASPEQPVTDEAGTEISALLPTNGIQPSAKPAGIQNAAQAAAALVQPGAPAIMAADQPPLAAEAPDAANVAALALASAAEGNNAATAIPAVQTETAALTAQQARPAAADGMDTAITGTAVSLDPPAAPEKPKTLFASLFGKSSAKKAQPVQVASAAQVIEPQLALAEAAPAKSEPDVALANLDKPLKTTVVTASPAIDNGELPGVRQNALFEIKRRDNASHDNDIDISEEDAAPIQVAYAPGLARLAPNGLKVQRESVDVACIKPQLVKVLKGIERHYGRQLVVTSGYRSPSFNRRVRGAKHSLHMFCAATDIQVPGVSKWSLAQYLRGLPGRGGVGTYCNTDSVHIDIGPNRDWNWRCSRRKK